MIDFIGSLQTSSDEHGVDLLQNVPSHLVWPLVQQIFFNAYASELGELMLRMPDGAQSDLLERHGQIEKAVAAAFSRS